MATDSGRASKGERTRQAILRAAIAQFGRDGFRATSVTDIARAAGVGGTVPYAYFADKEALFLAAIDEDAGGVIEQGLSQLLADEHFDTASPQMLIATLVGAVERQPLARRLLAGLEPHITDRVLAIPALEELRKVVVERLRAEQAAGDVRSDIDPVAMAGGIVAIMLSLLMSVVQLGTDAVAAYTDDVGAVFAAALDPMQVDGRMTSTSRSRSAAKRRRTRER
jgi:AcrR family transcriptional regulator